MKKVGIITIIDNDNYGNRLQNYAMQEFLKENNVEAITIKNNKFFNHFGSFKKRFILFLRYINSKRIFIKNLCPNRLKCFKNFNKNINFSKKTYSVYSKNIKNDYDFFVVGSDQVWKPFYQRLSDVDLLNFANDNQKISISASFGISELPDEYKEKTKNALNTFKAISVREDTGKNIVEELTGRKDVEVIVDPTMLVPVSKWKDVEKKPSCLKSDKFILNYFLGNLSESRKKAIEQFANDNECEIINILDKDSEFYKTGPAEFLYLERNAFLICTDSFHSSVFAILNKVPFIVFEREDKKANMNSRLDTLLRKFNLESQKYKEDKIEKYVDVKFEDSDKVLEVEKNKARMFLKNALNEERKDEN